jgi:DNA modification methylase
MDWRHALDLQTAGDSSYSRHVQTCIWGKTNWGVGDFYRGQYEMVFVYKSGQAEHINNIVRGKHGRSRSNLWTYAGATSFSKTRKQDLADHPTVKPVSMIADLIRDASNVSGLVLDPFAGSGTTLFAAHQTKRRAILFELDGRYVDLILRRALRLLKIEATHVGTGKTFTQAARERNFKAA